MMNIPPLPTMQARPCASERRFLALRRTFRSRSGHRSRAVVTVQALEPRLVLSTLAPHPHSYPGMSRAQAESYYFETFLPQQQTPASWVGNVKSGNAGTIDPAYEQAILNRVNSYRFLAGLPEVTLDPKLSVSAQRAALMMSANERLSHYPDSAWTHYSAEGAASAGRSNLYLGRAGTQAIDGYIDEGPPSNVELGHRRWILFPPLQSVGIGDIPGSGIGGAGHPAANVLDVISGLAPGYHHQSRTDQVSWPPPGHLPVALAPEVWSFSHPQADFSSARVQLTRNGVPVPVDIIHQDSGRFGDPIVAWTLPGNLLPSPTESFEVLITNVLVPDPADQGTSLHSYSYSTTLFDPFVTVPNPEVVSGTFATPFAFSATEIAVDRQHGFVEVEIVRQDPFGAAFPMLTLAAREDAIDQFADPSRPGQARNKPIVYPVQFRDGEVRARVRLPLASTDPRLPTETLTLDLYNGFVPVTATGTPRAPAEPIDSVRVTLRQPHAANPSPPPAAPPKTSPQTAPGRQTPADFDGDGITDFVVFTQNGSTGQFQIRGSLGGPVRTVPFGLPGDLPIIGDFDGDGVPDLGVYRFDPRAGSGLFRILKSSDGQILERHFGGKADLPIVGDFDGDGTDDLAVFGYSPNDGFSRFAILPSGGGPAILRGFGGKHDMAIAADFDGDGTTDIAVFGYSPNEGFSRFAILPSSGQPARSVPFGGRDDRPILGDFDGDGIDDIAVYGYSPNEGFSRFGVLYSTGRPTRSVPFGGRDDLPISGDFDGDGLTDLAVFGFSPGDGVRRFGILPSDGRPARKQAIDLPGAVGLPTSPGLLAERHSLATQSAALTATAPRSTLHHHAIALALLDDGTPAPDPRRPRAVHPAAFLSSVDQALDALSPGP